LEKKVEKRVGEQGACFSPGKIADLSTGRADDPAKITKRAGREVGRCGRCFPPVTEQVMKKKLKEARTKLVTVTGSRRRWSRGGRNKNKSSGGKGGGPFKENRKKSPTEKIPAVQEPKISGPNSGDAETS